MGTQGRFRSRYPGERIGRLTLLEPVYEGAVAKRWRCLCDCGRECSPLSLNLAGKSPTARSCGCLRVDACRARERRKDHPTHGVILTYYKRNAKTRGLDWRLSVDEFNALVSGNCHWCGASPVKKIIPHRTVNGQPLVIYTNGIDRLNNSGCYEIGNVVSCCEPCNRAKGIMSETEFVDWVQRVAAHLKGGGADV